MAANLTVFPHVGLRSPNLTNTTMNLQENFEIQLGDITWILTSACIIFTMQTGFGLLESGCVSVKNEANIWMKNIADISLGGLTYWIFGYGMSFGEGTYSNPFIGVGDFLVDPPVGDALMGPVFASFLFQLSFATTATTIVSGAMAERCDFRSYCMFSLLYTIVYSVPAGWVWSSHGFLNKLGAVDIAGSGPVHLVGKFTLIKNKGKAAVMDLVNSVLGAMVSITAGCFLYRAWESLLIGFIGGAIVSGSSLLIDRLHVDDPVGASAVHGACGLWGVIVVGLFADNPIPLETTGGRSGLFKGGSWYLLGVQTLTGICLMAWGFIVTMALVWIIDKIFPIRMDPYTELLGADITMHRIRHGQAGITRAVSALRPFNKSNSIEELGTVGINSGHGLAADKLHEMKEKTNVFQIFTNKAFVGDQTQPNASTFKNTELLNRRSSNTDYALHQTFDPIMQELDRGIRKKEKPNVITIQDIAEEFKGRKYKDLSPKEIEKLGELNASQDRFRHRFHEEDYKNDIDRSVADNFRWLD